MSSEKGTLLITGASGYLGGNMIKAAIEKGYNVRAVVRSNSSAQKVAAQFPQYKAQLSYAFVPDITKSDSYKGAFDGVTGVVHAASPFILNPKDNVEDLLEPAIHVKRIVATSSHASCVDISKGKRPGYVYDEKDWNPVTYGEPPKPRECMRTALPRHSPSVPCGTEKQLRKLLPGGTRRLTGAHWSPGLEFRPRWRAQDVADARRSAEGRAPRSGLASTSP
ncbi:hypothetical protein SCAR479_04884 [Seiridium cardinale]|uniref:NmrA-like domain-containing protein n=1 Tax=Seiridium cardinale TaxID=138064 RepID=A0ABR2Y4L2_9PEZI